MAAFVDAFQWPDSLFPFYHCLRGFDILGQAADTGIWRLKSPDKAAQQKADRTPTRDLLSSNASWLYTIKRILNKRFSSALSSNDSGALTAFKATFDASMEQVQTGRAQGPFSISQIETMYGHGKWRGMIRFPVIQGEKVRPCDDGTGSGHNPTWFTPETTQQMPARWSAAMGRAFTDRASSLGDAPWTLGGTSDDEPSAYQSSPARQPEYTVVLLVVPFSGDGFVAGQIVAFVPRGLNFGLSAAVLQYCRKPALWVTIARRLFAAIVHSYIDDFTTVEPAFAVGKLVPSASGGLRRPGSSQGVLWAVGQLLHWTLSEAKFLPWSQVSTSTGVVTDFSTLTSNGNILLRIKESTRTKALEAVLRALLRRSITPNEASSLASKLRWVLCLGLVGMGALQALRAHQTQGESWSDDLDYSLRYLSSLLKHKPPDAVLSCARASARPILIWSDASWRPKLPLLYGEGRIAFVVLIPVGPSGYRLVFAESLVPFHILRALQSIRAQKTCIAPLEELGIAAPYFCPEIVDALRGSSVIHWADNKCANGAAIKGYSKAKDLALIVHALHRRLSESQIRLWIEFVPSKGNIADLPSRGDFALLHKLGATRVSFKLPNFSSWD